MPVIGDVKCHAPYPDTSDVNSPSTTAEQRHALPVDLVEVADIVPLPLWVSGGLATTNWVNRAMEAFTGRSAEGHAGTGWLDTIHPDDRADYLALCDARWAANEPYEARYRLRRADGAWRRVVNTAVPWIVDGQLLAYVGSVVDVTDQLDLLEQVDADRRQLGVLVAILSELVGVTTEGLPAALQSVVEQIGTFTGVDRVGLVRIDHSRRTMELEYSWHSERVGDDFEVQQSISLDEHPAVAARLDNHEIVHIGDVELMDVAERVDQEMLRNRGIRANCVVPIVLGGVLNGLLFLDDHHRTRRWLDLLPALRVVGHALASAMGRHQAEIAQRAVEARFQALFDTNPLPMFVIDPTTTSIQEANSVAVGLYGDRERLIGRRFADLHPGHERDAVARIGAESHSSPIRSGPWQHHLASGAVIDVEISAQSVPLGDGTFQIVVVHDVTDQRELERQLRHQAFHDSLTGLANRALLGERLEWAVASASAGAPAPAVILLDLDGFKTINDSLGHHAGDRILVQVAERLRAAVGEGDTVARLGGDEFAIVVVGADAGASARSVATRIEAVLAEPIWLDGRDVVLSASFGISIGDTAGRSADLLLRDADLAMFAAKDAGRGRVVEFAADLEQQAHARLELLSDLRRAVREHEFRLHYQPTVDLATGDLRSVEALVRWQHPDLGLLGPGQFLPLVEHLALIEQIGAWVIEEACRQHRAWTDEFGWSPPIAVNVAPRQLAIPSFASSLVETLSRHSVPPRDLVVEITERSLLDDEASLARLHELRAVGIRLAVDDFGTGYSSLSYLRHLPVDILKIDRSFVAAIDEAHEQTIAMVSMIVGLADVLGLDTIAEGIEEPLQRSVLERLGCRAGQGYLIAKPAPPEALAAMLRAGASAALARSARGAA